MLFIKAALDRGWAVAVSDYEGLGTPGQHTYVVGRSEGRAVLDMARAAQRLPGTGLTTSTPVGPDSSGVTAVTTTSATARSPASAGSPAVTFGGRR